MEAVKAWVDKGCRGSVIFSTGTGKTEIAFECARWAAKLSGQDRFTILFLVPRIVLIEQNVSRLGVTAFLMTTLASTMVSARISERSPSARIRAPSITTT